MVSTLDIPKIGEIGVVFIDEEQFKEFKHFVCFISIDIIIDGKDKHGNDVRNVIYD